MRKDQLFERFLKKEIGLYFNESNVKYINFNSTNLNNLDAWYYLHQSSKKTITYYLLDAGGNIWKNHQCLGPKN